LLFRNSHTGTVWFDDVSITEVQDAVVQFDGAAVTATPPNPLPYNSTNRIPLLTADGLQVEFAQDGGVGLGGTDGTKHLQASAAGSGSGWFVCERTGNSDWWNVGGSATSSNGVVRQLGTLTNLNVAAAITYSVTNNAIRLQATVSNLLSADRAVSLYFA